MINGMANGSDVSQNEPYKLSMSAVAVDVNRITLGDNIDGNAEELLSLINSGDVGAIFPLSQILFSQKRFDDAKVMLEKCPKEDYRATFLSATMMFDGLGGHDLSKENQMAAVEMMKEVGQIPTKNDPFVYAACYNVGCAYFLSVGVKYTSPEEAERWLLMAADDGNPMASIRAQTALGMFYSRPEHAKLDQAFFWHSEAVGNGSLESQAALGVMYERGLGISRNEESAFECLRDASARGSCFATGYLASLYYKRRLYVKCVELAVRCLETFGNSNFDDPVWQQEAALSASTTARRGLSIAAFYLARCLQLGKGVRADERRSHQYLRQSIDFDGDMAAQLMVESQIGKN